MHCEPATEHCQPLWAETGITWDLIHSTSTWTYWATDWHQLQPKCLRVLWPRCGWEGRQTHTCGSIYRACTSSMWWWVGGMENWSFVPQYDCDKTWWWGALCELKCYIQQTVCCWCSDICCMCSWSYILCVFFSVDVIMILSFVVT